VLADNMLICIADDDAATLAVLSSRIHTTWALKAGGWMGMGNDPRYTKSRCFDPFPFPALTEDVRPQLRPLGEALDSHRKTVLADHPDLTLTGLYNSLATLRAGLTLSARDQAVKHRGLLGVLADLHDEIDRRTAEAYGWPTAQSESDIVSAVVRLNRQRAEAEAGGDVHWLRPAYQGARAPAPRLSPTWSAPAAQDTVATPIAFPGDPFEQPLAIQAALRSFRRPVGADELVRYFGHASRGRRIRRVLSTLYRYGHVQQIEGDRWVVNA
jgi:hypothetical protein